MKRYLAPVVIVLLGWMTSVDGAAAAEAGGERSTERCSDPQAFAARAHCGHAGDGIEQNSQAPVEQAPCEKSRGGCVPAEGRINRAVRPPFWIGHHYSGL